MTPHESAETGEPTILPVQGNRRCGACSAPDKDESNRELVYERGDGVWGWSLPLCSRCRVNEYRRLTALGFTKIHPLEYDGTSE